MSFRPWLDSIHYSLNYSYKKLYIVSIASTSPEIRAQAVLPTEKSCLVAHSFERVLWECWTLLYKNEKRNHQMQSVLFHTNDTDKFTSPKINLLVFQVKTNEARNQGLVGSWWYNFRHLQQSCSNRAAVLPTCLDDIAQDYPSYCSSSIPEIRTIVLFLPF